MKKRNADPTQEGILALGEARFSIIAAHDMDPRWNNAEGDTWAKILRMRIEEVEDEPAKYGPAMKEAILLSIEEFNAAHEIRRGFETQDEGKMVFHARHILRCRERMKIPYRATEPLAPTFQLPSAALSDDDILKVCEEWADAELRSEEG